MKKVHGVCPIAPAVFHDDGSLDLEGYRHCCDAMLKGGAQALALFGIAGEYYKFDREEEDFSLTVMSAGIGQPLILPRQYRKMIGKEVEVVLKDGSKLIATLKSFSDDTLTLTYTEKVAVEGKKRKVATEIERSLALSDIKTTKEYLNFK